MFGWGVLQVCYALSYRWTDPIYLASAVMLPLVLGLGLLGYVNWNGSSYVEHPNLCPDLITPNGAV